MNIQPVTFLSEVLFRFNASGLQGAHAKDSQQLVDLDVPDNSPSRIVGEKEMDPRAVTVEEAESLIGASNASLITELSGARDQIKALTNDLAAAAASRDAALALIDTIRTAVTAPAA